MEETKAIEASVESIATQEVEDNEAKVLALEAEKNRLIEESANYKLAYLKEKKKKESVVEDEDEDDRMRRIAQETLAESRLAEIARERDAISKKPSRKTKNSS